MDYILKTIEKKIRRFEGTAEARVYHQVRVEYAFYLLLSYFWNKNFEEIGVTDFVLQGNIIREIQRPSIGTVANPAAWAASMKFIAHSIACLDSQ